MLYYLTARSNLKLHMKHLKKMLRVCALILFMMLSTTGIGIFGVAPTLTRDRKLFADIESKAEVVEKEEADPSITQRFNF
jgi:hypothetical protein